MTIQRDRKVTPADSDAWHLWTVTTPAGSITLSALHTDQPVKSSPMTRQLVAATPDGGAWVFDVIGVHTPTNASDTDFGCRVHDDCEQDAIVSRIALPAWDRVVRSEVADDVVFAELTAIHAAVFGAVSA